MPDPSPDGRHGGGALKTEIRTALEPAGEEEERRPRWRAADLLFFAFFLAYFGGAIVALAMGVGSLVASLSEATHESFHVLALGTGLLARAYQRMADAAHIVPSLPLAILGTFFSLFNLTLAVFLLWLRPRDRTARLLAVAMVGTAGVFNLTSQLTIEVLPLTQWESVMQALAHIVAGVAYTYALVLFPDGRWVPRWRPPVLAALYLPVTAGAAFLALRVQGTARPGVLLLFFGLAVPIVGVSAQAYRFRTSDDYAEQQQARLLFWALLPALAIGLWFVTTQGFGSIEVGLAGRHLPDQPVEVFRVFQPVFLLVPLALFLGLLRYRLWDIDRVINRTLVYGLVTGILLAAYLVIVVLLQRLLQPFTAGNDIAVAVSTLAAAAAFVPVRRRIQDFVDRRFYRHRYDAQKTIEQFSTRLRNEIDLETLAYELRGVVARTIQPEQITLLMRNDEGCLEWQWTYRGQPRD